MAPSGEARSGYTVLMFVLDVSKEMGHTRTVELPDGPNGEKRTAEITNLEWALQFVKLKIQEMIYHGRKTDQCGVIIFGAEDTKNIINDQSGGYENVVEYIPIGTPNAGTLAKLDKLTASSVYGDPLDAIIVGLETQSQYLGKKAWTKKIYLVTDGQGPIELEDWEMTADKMNERDVQMLIAGVDFDQDDEEYRFEEEEKTHEKRQNEKFFHAFAERLKTATVGTLAYALQEVIRPDIQGTRSTLSPTVLRLGDANGKPEEAWEILVKTSKCTAVTRPKSFKKFAIRKDDDEDGKTMQVDDEDKENVFVQLKPRTEYFVDRNPEGEEGKDVDGDTKMEVDEEEIDDETGKKKKDALESIEKEQLIRGFKYGTSYVPCPDGQFTRLPTKKGIDICGFFPADNFKRELSMSEIQYVWADPDRPQQQVALSSLVQAMSMEDGKKRKPLMAIARWVTRDGMDPKMGVLLPTMFDEVHCFLWAQMPFADDVRKYTFASLDHLVNKKGEVLTEHPYIPTEEQQDAMDELVDAMDLMEAGPKDEEGNRTPWYSPPDSYNPAFHRVKQAQFHCAIVDDIATNPVPPPHPETTKYFEPPKKVVKAAKEPLERCREKFKVKHIQKEVKRNRKDGHVHANDDDDDVLLLDRKPSRPTQSQSQSQVRLTQASPSGKGKEKATQDAEDSVTEDESDEEELLLPKLPAKEKDKEPADKPKSRQPLPTPARSLSPLAQRPPEKPRSRSGRGKVDADIDRGVASGRIIGNTYPLEDFNANLEKGDVVSKAVEDLGTVIEEVVMRPFANRRTKEMIECMRAMRQTAMVEDEVDAWNTFLENLHEKCMDSKPGNEEFWEEVKKEGRKLSYLTKADVKKYGGTSTKTEQDAEELMR
ncbi:ATP-dependent DNA helicase yku80 [Marasmius tenuissimus]|uniref:ATP-dependent DNA helicase II subunit 2 n=1 Tax=Marasmius tenuissimus TaxID=585030 RepID=A0ABR2ZWG1_9AGAR